MAEVTADLGLLSLAATPKLAAARERRQVLCQDTFEKAPPPSRVDVRDAFSRATSTPEAKSFKSAEAYILLEPQNIQHRISAPRRGALSSKPLIQKPGIYGEPGSTRAPAN